MIISDANGNTVRQATPRSRTNRKSPLACSGFGSSRRNLACVYGPLMTCAAASVVTTGPSAALIVVASAGCANTVCASSAGDRKSVVSGKSVSVRVDLGGRRIIKKTNTQTHTNMTKDTAISAHYSNHAKQKNKTPTLK